MAKIWSFEEEKEEQHLTTPISKTAVKGVLHKIM